MPPRYDFSTIAVLKPSCAARIAVTYPPGPEPIMITSKEVSGMCYSLERLFPSPPVGERSPAPVRLRRPPSPTRRERRKGAQLTDIPAGSGAGDNNVEGGVGHHYSRALLLPSPP